MRTRSKEVAMSIIASFVVASVCFTAVSCKPGRSTDLGSTTIVEPIAFTVTVDRSRTVAEMVKAGNYDWSSDSINDQSFPANRNGAKEKTEIILLHFDKEMTSEQALAEVERRKLRPADIMQLLSIGEQKPELQMQFQMVGLSVGQSPFGVRIVACLLNDGVSRRRLDLRNFESSIWQGYARFVCVRK